MKTDKLILIIPAILIIGIMAAILIMAWQNEKAWNRFVREQEIRTGQKALQAISRDEYEKLPPDSQKLYSK